jgi:hypothetical protein
MHNDLAIAVAAVPPVKAPVPRRLPPVPWRDPHTVSPAKLAEYITALEKMCEENPHSADLRTCLGMAHAMNYDVYKSMDALDCAVSLEPGNFWAQVKHAELYYRLRALARAEEETLRALDLAGNTFELGVARRQLQTIRELKRAGTQKPEWRRSLKAPAWMFAAMFVILCAAVWFR